MLWKTDTYTGWGRVLGATGRMARPERQRQIVQALKDAPGPAIGNRRSYGDAALNSDGPVIAMTRMDRLIDFDETTGVLHAEAGVTISELVEIFAPRGWVPPVMPGTGFATLGGCIANDVHGKNHHKDGSFGQHVDSLRVIGPDGTSRDLSATTDADLFNATLGGLGQTGIIESAKIRMASCASEYIDLTEQRIDTLAEFLSAFEASTAPYSVGWIDATAKGEALGRGVLEEGAFADRPAPYAKRAKSRGIPANAPGFLLSSPVVKLFNQAYFRRIPEAGRKRTRHLIDFFFPLDRLTGWNKLYGKAGFHQFQCVLPDDAAAITLDAMLRAVAEQGLASPLAVLKRMGPGRAGPMSFPMEGYTLAIDFPNKPRAAGLIRELEAMTVDAGGRLYFAKDALMDPAHVAAMYPEIETFRTAAASADPDAVFATDLVRRLNLRGSA